MGSKDGSKAPRYTANLLEIPGMAFDISIEDPRARIQKYIDTFRQTEPGVHKVRRLVLHALDCSD